MPTNLNGHVLQYNLNWMVSTFSSRDRAEALLSPERESGNLTTRDYDTAIQFLPGTHRRYPIIGLAVGAAIGMAFKFRFRHSRLSVPKQVFIFLSTGFFGYTVGEGCQAAEHALYVRNIENPDGYKRAIENVQKGLGLNGPVYSGIILERSYQVSPDDALPQPTSAYDGSSTERSQSKWDQIRVANSRTAQNSAWDALRQQHEKIRVKPSQDRDDDKWNPSDG